MADLGQVFTKSAVARYMVSLFDLPPYASIMEPCCGGGAFLQALTEGGFSRISACELDPCLCEECQTRFPQIQLFQQDFLKLDHTGRYDGVIMNPPYIRQEKIDELAEWGITKKSLLAQPVFRHLSSRANLYMYFVAKAIEVLKPGGQLLVIFPSSWMNAESAHRFQAQLVEQCGLQRQIHIFGEVFEQAAIVDVIILKLIKDAKSRRVQEEHIEVRNGRLYPVAAEDKRLTPFFSHPFSELATARRGLTTGCNRMYINPCIDREQADGLRPILSSPKNLAGYSTQGAHLDTVLALSGETSSPKVRHYLEGWKKKIEAEKMPETLYRKIARNEPHWYTLREPSSQGILFSYFVRNDMKFIMNEEAVLARDNFYIISPQIDLWLMFALLNNYYTYYQLELCGKRYGAGLLKLQRYDLERLVFPAPQDISPADQKSLIELSQRLVRTNDRALICDITQILSAYSTMSYKEITRKYFSAKTNRLEAESHEN